MTHDSVIFRHGFESRQGLSFSQIDNAFQIINHMSQRRGKKQQDALPLLHAVLLFLLWLFSVIYDL